jgi:hypothetical protein
MTMFLIVDTLNCQDLSRKFKFLGDYVAKQR